MQPKEIVASKEPKQVTTYFKKEIVSDIHLENTAGRKIFVLYNSTDSFLAKSDTIGAHFQTECMACEAVQPYRDHLLFANQLELFPDKVFFHRQELTLPATGIIKRIGGYGSEKTVRFKFNEGRGEIRHLKQSCNDAELKEVILSYENGEVKIRNVLNASFFQYDLDKDGTPEQYILANRNCSHELAIIQIL